MLGRAKPGLRLVGASDVVAIAITEVKKVSFTIDGREIVFLIDRFSIMQISRSHTAHTDHYVQTWKQVLKKRGILTLIWIVGAAVVAGLVVLIF